MQARFDTKLEVSFVNLVMPQLAALGLTLDRMKHDENRNVMSVSLVLPIDADAALRFKVAELLADYEQRLELAVIFEPSFWFADFA